MSVPPIISVQDDNQSTLTIDTSSNGVSAGPASGTNQWENYNPTRGWDITAPINSMNEVERTQCQFGYWNNDEFSFNDATGMIYFMVNLAESPNINNTYITILLCCKIPKKAWSTFGLENLTGGAQWQELTPGEAARNAQQSLAKLICYYMNNHAVEVRMAPVTPAGRNWKDPLYVDADGGVGAYNAGFAASGLNFAPGGTATAVTTQNFITVQVNGGWAARFYFMDGPYSIYNTRGGAFSSGLGNYARNKSVTKLAMGPIAPGTFTSSTVVSPYTYLVNLSGRLTSSPGNPVYFPADGSNQTAYNFAGTTVPVKITDVEWAARNNAVLTNFGNGQNAPFPRATTLLNSKYYIAVCDDLFEGSTVSHNGNGRMPSQVMGVIEATAEKRNEWAEYTGQAVHPVQAVSNAVQVVNYTFQNDQAEPMICMSNMVFPRVPPNIPVFAQGDLVHFPDFEWMSMYFETTDPAGTFPIIASPARVQAETFVAAFQTARRPS